MADDKIDFISGGDPVSIIMISRVMDLLYEKGIFSLDDVKEVQRHTAELSQAMNNGRR